MAAIPLNIAQERELHRLLEYERRNCSAGNELVYHCAFPYRPDNDLQAELIDAGYLVAKADRAHGTIVRITTKSTDETTKNATGEFLTDKPLVVLVNGNTSSSAEVIAASLKDNERATLVGTTTLGKGSVQVTHELTFGGALRYTAAYYKSPLDHDIDGLGINPDISIGRSDDEDNQKSLAMETAQSMVRE